MRDKNYGRQFVELDIFPLNQLSQENFQESLEFKRDEPTGKGDIIQWKHEGFWRVYNQKYSAVVGVKGKYEAHPTFTVRSVVGYHTRQDELPKMGTATYHGVAFDETEQGKLTYHVDFADKQGYGEITGLSKFGTITLEPGSISNQVKDPDIRGYYPFGENIPGSYYDKRDDQLNIVSAATNANDAQDKVSKYRLHFFGPEAKEVTGVVFSNTYDGLAHDGVVGFGGSR